MMMVTVSQIKMLVASQKATGFIVSTSTQVVIVAVVVALVLRTTSSNFGATDPSGVY